MDQHQATEALTASSSGAIPETKTSSAAAAATSPRRVDSPRVAAESSPGGGDPAAGGVVNPSLDMSSVLNDRAGVEKMVRSFNDELYALRIVLSISLCVLLSLKPICTSYICF